MSLDAAYGPLSGSKPTVARGPVDENIRCPVCNKLLIEQAGRPWRATCRGCGALVAGDVEDTSYRIVSPPTKGRWAQEAHTG